MQTIEYKRDVFATNLQQRDILSVIFGTGFAKQRTV